MSRPSTIYAAILAEHGNADERYPRPLTCDVCCERPVKRVSWDKPLFTPDRMIVWYVTEDDPLPEGWQVIEDPTYHYKMTYCPACYEDRAEGKELEFDY